MWGWLKGLGKIATMAAPYIAAPFTGGASLLATGLANKAASKWAQHDANENIKKGLAPSGFDKGIGKAGAISNVASMFIPGGQLGALGKLGNVGGKLAGAATKGGIGGTLAKVGMGALGGGSGSLSKAGGILASMGMSKLGGIGSGGSNQGIGPSSNMIQSYDPYDQSNPNLATSIEAGRQAAMGPNYSPIPYSSIQQNKKKNAY